MIRHLPTRVLIVFLCLFLLLIIGLLTPRDEIAGSIQETKIAMANRSKQKTVSEFNKERKEYSYVSFDNLYSNTDLYYGTKIYQVGHIKNFDSAHKYLLIALDGNDKSRTIKLKYNLSSFARGDVDLQENDPVKFYGRVMSTDSYVNEKGRDVSRPVVSADFIQTKNNNRSDNNGIV